MIKLTVAHKALRYAIGSAIIIEGLDKFFNLLVNWKIYLADPLADIWPWSAESFLYVLGITEITVGIIFLLRARPGGLLVAGLMAGIIIDLLLLGDFYNMILLN